MALKSEPLTVAEFTEGIKEFLENNFAFQNVQIRGEISNWKEYRSGFFFALKDDEAVLNCKMWSSYAASLKFSPKDGDEVVVFGSISVYAPRGEYSLVVKSIQPYGEGQAMRELRELVEKLRKEGIFDPSKKRPIPRFPKRIGLICGAHSAAEADLWKNIQRRWPIAEIVEFPSLVQGKEAPKSLLEAFLRAETAELDTLIIARGGGSNEDLSAFNDETLVRAIAERHTPVISAVGHEIDVTIVDLVADLRVSTPTGAAEAATPDQYAIREGLLDYSDRLKGAMLLNLTKRREKVSMIASRPFFKDPMAAYAKTKERVANLELRLKNGYNRVLVAKANRIDVLRSRFEAMNPKKVAERGYSITQTESGKIITSKEDIKAGETIKTIVRDGIITSKVIE